MSNREYAVAMINELSEEQIDAVIEFLSAFVDRSIIMKLESQAFRNNQHPKTYNNFKEYMAEMEADENGV